MDGETIDFLAAAKDIKDEIKYYIRKVLVLKVQGNIARAGGLSE